MPTNKQNAINAASFAGFTGDQLNTIVAIGERESGFNPRAHNSVPPDNSYGIWQINMIGNLGPARRAQFGITKNEELFDPIVNARAAWEISSHGSDFTPWSTFKPGDVSKGGNPKVTPPNSVDVPNPIDAAKAAVNAVPNAISGAANAISSAFTKSIDIGFTVILAVVLLFIGVALIRSKDTKAAAKAVVGIASPIKKVQGVHGQSARGTYPTKAGLTAPANVPSITSVK